MQLQLLTLFIDELLPKIMTELSNQKENFKSYVTLKVSNPIFIVLAN